MKKTRFSFCIITYILLSATLIGCGQTPVASLPGSPSVAENSNPGSSSVSKDKPVSETKENGSASTDANADAVQSDTPVRDNTPVCLEPVAGGIAETHNDVASIDYSHADLGYVMVNYTGDCPKLKLRITGPDAIVYTYDLHAGSYETFPLSSGNGDYEVTVYENISGTSYATCLYEKVNVKLTDEFSPFLYPNQYVNFTSDSKVVEKGAALAKDANSDLEVVTNIYDFIISSITYDYGKASDPPTGYTTDVDEILESGTGICLDYAAVMASMLRSQRIPTRLEVGYAQDAYHAWISIYVEDIGWLNGIIEFDGTTWTLVDPTFGANTDDKTLKKFIGNGSNYTLQKMY